MGHEQSEAAAARGGGVPVLVEAEIRRHDVARKVVRESVGVAAAKNLVQHSEARWSQGEQVLADQGQTGARGQGGVGDAVHELVRHDVQGNEGGCRRAFRRTRGRRRPAGPNGAERKKALTNSSMLTIEKMRPSWPSSPRHPWLLEEVVVGQADVSVTVDDGRDRPLVVLVRRDRLLPGRRRHEQREDVQEVALRVQGHGLGRTKSIPRLVALPRVPGAQLLRRAGDARAEADRALGVHVVEPMHEFAAMGVDEPGPVVLHRRVPGEHEPP